jgi:hypothetical protein
MGFEDAIVTGLIVCCHVDNNEASYVKVPMILAYSIIDFMTTSLLSLCGTFICESIQCFNVCWLFHQTSKVVSSRSTTILVLMYFNLLQHDVQFRKVVIRRKFGVNRICFLPNHICCAIVRYYRIIAYVGE